MPYVTKRADLLERSLQGFASTDQEVQNLVASAARIPALTSRASAPRDEFVSALGLRLRAEALTLPAREVRSGPAAVAAHRSARRPMVFVVGRGLPRILAGVAASLLVVGAVVSGASRSALPGSLLYPVKALLDQAAVQLAGSDFDRGVTLLSQGQEQIGDVRALVERDGASADPAPVDGALLSAHNAVSVGQRMLLSEFDRTGDIQALIAVQDFAVRTLPQLKALRPMVPAESTAGVDAIIALLQETRTTLARTIAECGEPCASLAGPAIASPRLTPDLMTPLTPGGTPVPDLPAVGGVPEPGLTTDIPGPGGVVVGPAVPPVPRLPIPRVTGGIGDPVAPPVTTGPITLSPPPVVIPTQPLPEPIATPALPPPPTGPLTLP